MPPELTLAPGAADPRRMTRTAAYYLAFVILGMMASIFGPTLQGISKNTGAGIDQLSYIISLRSFGYLCGSLLAGRLYDRARGHPLMAGAVFMLAACLFAIPTISRLWLLVMLLPFVGVFQGLLDVGGNTLLTWLHRDNLQMPMNGLHFFFGFGALFSPIIVGAALLNTGAITWAYWSVAALMLPTALWIALLPSPLPAAHSASHPSRPPIPALILLAALFMFVYVGCEISYGNYISKYAIDLGLASEASAAFLASGFWGAITAGRLVGIPLSARFSPRAILLVDLLIVAAGLGVVFAAQGSLAALWAGTILIGAGMASIFPTVLILAGQSMTMTGVVTGWIFAGSSLGGMTVTWLVGQLFARSGPEAMMRLLAGGIALNLLLYAVMMTYTRRQRDARSVV